MDLKGMMEDWEWGRGRKLLVGKGNCENSAGCWRFRRFQRFSVTIFCDDMLLQILHVVLFSLRIKKNKTFF